MDVRVKMCDSMLNSGRINRLSGQPGPFYALMCSILLYFAADGKELIKSYEEYLWSPLSPISL